MRDRDLLGTSCRESGYLFSVLQRGKRKGKGEKSERQREREKERGGKRSREKEVRQKLPLWERET